MTSDPLLTEGRTPLSSFLRILAWTVGGVVLAVLGVFVAGAVYLERSLEAEKDAASIDLTGEGYGLEPGWTATYEDGVRATVSEARRIPPVPNDERRRPGELTYEFSVTYVNGGDGTVEIGDFEEITADKGGTGPMAGLAYDAKNPRKDDDWFPDTLAEGERVTVPVRVNVPADARWLSFETHVTKESREHALWNLPLAR
ncbi:hypothetical protein ACIRNI_18425 [Streptomyces sp. NPDC093546]|uniref:hypothetical protein n=1 Tax=Streptomyces sp. NPDC093546 TaxID=3366040 RepID=UPI00380F18BC